MNPFEAMVIIAIFAIIANVIKSKRVSQPKTKKRSARHEQDDHEDVATNQELQLEIMAMRKRIAALEAIVTDKSYDLKKEIDDL